MKVLYVAGAIEAGGSSGGWTHVTEVACGLKELGHEVRVIARAPRTGQALAGLDCGARLATTRLPQQLALLGLPQVRRAFRDFEPDVVMERFYNFAGAGVLLAHRAGLPSLLEVNAPMVDPPGSLKTRLDALMLGSLRRWAVKQARWSAAIVTPLATTVPPEVPRRKVHELPWGANVERFAPSIRAARRERPGELTSRLGLVEGAPVAAFLGSFRAWHGASHFARAARTLLERGSDLAFLAIGGGPELGPLRQEVRSWGLPPGRFVFTGPQPHRRVPELLALADFGVAPFDLAAYAPLATFGFYWSPLKVFEYMAMALPVVTVDVKPLNEIVRPDKEGLLYRSGDVEGLANAMERIGRDPDLRARLGRSARERVTAHYSWRVHCEALDRILRDIADAGRGS